MENFFPPGFWKTVAMSCTVVFFVLGVDFFLGAKLVSRLSRSMNKKFHVDQAVLRLLKWLKEGSDREFDIERSLMNGWGRLVVGGFLIMSGVLVLMLLPKL